MTTQEQDAIETMIDMHKEQDAIETMIDMHGLDAVLDCISAICGLKAEHVIAVWQDDDLSQNWEKAAAAIDVAVSKVLDLNLD